MQIGSFSDYNVIPTIEYLSFDLKSSRLFKYRRICGVSNTTEWELLAVQKIWGTFLCFCRRVYPFTWDTGEAPINYLHFSKLAGIYSRWETIINNTFPITWRTSIMLSLSFPYLGKPFYETKTHCIAVICPTPKTKGLNRQ